MSSSAVLTVIEDRVHRRRERWETHEVHTLPPPEWMNEATIVSRFTRCGLSTKRRFLKDSILISVNSTKETPSALARDYLVASYKRGPMWTAAQHEKIEEEKSAQPLYCKPTTFTDGYYIDARAAYWSVMVRCGWGLNYYPGRWLGITRPPLDFPFTKSKVARNSLVTVGCMNKMQMWSPDKGDWVQYRYGKHANTQLYTLIQDCLNGMASEAVAAGAVYVFGDGCIAPSYKSMRAVVQVMLDWGFVPVLKGKGAGFVNNLGSYRVGGMKTKILDTAKNEHDEIKKLDYHRWLAKRMDWATARAPWHEMSLTPKKEATK